MEMENHFFEIDNDYNIHQSRFQSMEVHDAAFNLNHFLGI